MKFIILHYLGGIGEFLVNVNSIERICPINIQELSKGVHIYTPTSNFYANETMDVVKSLLGVAYEV